MMAKMIASEALEPSIPTVVAGPDTDGSSHAAFDGAADTDGRDDLNGMPDCEGESKADSDGLLSSLEELRRVTGRKSMVQNIIINDNHAKDNAANIQI